MKKKEQLIEEMKAATVIIENAAREWQEEWPDAKPACFLMACAKFVSDSFAQVSDGAFEAMLDQMRMQRQSARKSAPPERQP